MEMNMQQDAITISTAHPHSARFRPLDINAININQLPPAQCIVLPTMSTGFIAKIFKSPPLTNSTFKTEDDFKAYWLSAHGLMLPKIEAYVQVRLGDMELTYPSCCLWESKLTEVRSHATDTSQIISQLIDDLKAIKLFSIPLLQFKETATPLAPKVAWVKSSAILKADTSNISDLPNVEQITPKSVSTPKPSITPVPVSTAVTTSSENVSATKVTIPEKTPTNTANTDLAPKSLPSKPRESPAVDSKKKTLGPKKRKIATTPKFTDLKVDAKNKKKEKESATQSEEGAQGETHTKSGGEGPSIDDVLAFEDVLEDNTTADKIESAGKIYANTKTKDVTNQSGKKHTLEEESKPKSKRSKVEVDVSKLDFSIQSLNSRTVPELQAFCRKEKLKISGTKPDLVARVQGFLEPNQKKE
eukprot:Phypoly_transcript_07338.p1 GENE.Phypoly_transcript_07338~~Phypoly_transcript_07338.p1  ORF type:complete len:416 (+),score=71.92 Phypoly_transcript_07338:262-1509(+)